MPSAVVRALAAAREIDAMHFAYAYGGGHGAAGGPYDCSGAVSAVLRQAGLLAGAITSGDFVSYGEPGPGRYISIYANSGHVYMAFASAGFFGTSYENPGGGAGFFAGSVRPGFVVRHPPGL